MTAEEAIRELQRRRFKITPQREMVISLLASGKVYSADEVWRLAKQKYSRISLDTIYRILHLLVETKIAREVHFEDGMVRFEIVAGDHHHYLVCRKCGRIEKVPCMLNTFIADLKEECSWFMITDHELTIYGNCKECV